MTVRSQVTTSQIDDFVDGIANEVATNYAGTPILDVPLPAALAIPLVVPPGDNHFVGDLNDEDVPSCQRLPTSRRVCGGGPTWSRPFSAVSVVVDQLGVLSCVVLSCSAGSGRWYRMSGADADEHDILL